MCRRRRWFADRAPLRALAALLLLVGCAPTSMPPAPEPPQPPAPRAVKPRPYKVMGEWYTPLADARGFEQEGLASWYGAEFHGRRTSNGETYDMHAVSAAHKTLPLGTYVRVYNLHNGRSLDVRINGRGPFVRGRIIDLSYGAARKLGVVGPGTAPVKIVALGRPASSSADRPAAYVPTDYYTGNFTFQVGAFADESNARRLAAQLGRQYENAHISRYDAGGKTFYRVRVGRCSTLEAADAFEKRLMAQGFRDVFTVAE
jgi:rare lipoprotein A